jgi:hypothetical protein
LPRSSTRRSPRSPASSKYNIDDIEISDDVVTIHATVMTFTIDKFNEHDEGTYPLIHIFKELKFTNNLSFDDYMFVCKTIFY